jgi:hypothetical protein
MKRLPLKRKKHSDPVTPEMRERVLERDEYRCVAPLLGASSACANRWGDEGIDDLTLDHIREFAMMGKRAPSDEKHMVTLCYHHHLHGWATAHRDLLREYLRMKYEF